MSLLSGYLRTLREKQDLTDQNVAQRSGLDLETYQTMEKNPEKVPLYRLVSILKAVEMDSQEFLAMSAVANDMFG